MELLEVQIILHAILMSMIFSLKSFLNLNLQIIINSPNGKALLMKLSAISGMNYYTQEELI